MATPSPSPPPTPSEGGVEGGYANDRYYPSHYHHNSNIVHPPQAHFDPLLSANQANNHGIERQNLIPAAAAAEARRSTPFGRMLHKDARKTKWVYKRNRIGHYCGRVNSWIGVVVPLAFFLVVIGLIIWSQTGPHHGN